MNTDLRKKAEKFLEANPVETPTLSTVEVQQLFHELDVKQVEMAIQNEEMKKTVSELEAARDAYAALFNAAPVGYLTVDHCHTIIGANPAAAEMLGVDRAALLDRSFTDFVRQEHQDDWHAHCHEVMTGNRDHAVDVELQRADGSTFMAELICRPRPGNASESWHCLEILIDISDRAKAEQDLVESRELLQTVVNHISAGVSLIRGSDLHLVLLNPAYQAIAPEREMLGKTLDEIFPESDQDFSSICRRVLDTGEPHEVHNERNKMRRRSDGPVEETYSSWSLHRIHLPGHEGWGLLNTAWETTETMLAAKRLQADLEAMSRLQDVGTLFVREGNLDPVLHAIVDAAIAIAGADFGNCQLFDSGSEGLKIVAQRGLPDWWLDYWNGASRGQGSCSTALERCERVIVEDVEKSSIFKGSEALDIQLRAGVHAVQSTPLIGRTGKPLGMLSTHFKTPHRPDEQTLRLLDLLARQTADIIERAQAEAALQDSEIRYRGIYEQAADAIVLFDPETLEILECNEETYRRLGYTREEFSTLSFPDFDAVESEEIMMQHCRQIVGEGSAVFETRQRTKSGNLLDVEIRVKALKLGDRQLAMGIWRDITARKKAEKALQKSEQELSALSHELERLVAERTSELQESEGRFRALFEYSPDAACLMDLSGRILGTNKAGELLTEYHRDELIGHTIFELDIIHADSVPLVTGNLERLAHGEAVDPVELLFVRKDGSPYTVEVTACSMNMSGQPVVCAMARDITTRKQADAERERLAQQRQLALDAARLGWWQFNPETREGQHDERVMQMFGIEGERATPDQVAERIHSHDRDRVWAAVYAAIDPAHPQPYDLEYRVIRPDGEIRWVEAHGLAIFEGEGEGRRAVDFVGTVEDITERRQLREALEKRVLALTQPINHTDRIAFEDLFDLQQIQKVQDEFSNATGVASVITHPDGTPITEPSNFTRLCFDIIRNTEQGLANCQKSDAVLGAHCSEGPIIQPCLSCGLWDAGASIEVGGKHIANWLIGQVRDETQTDDQMRAYAREIGADEEVFVEAFHQVPFMSREQFTRIAQSLFTLANQLSTSAYQNVQQARFIAAQKRAEEALRESETRFRMVYENAAIGIAIGDRQNGYFLQCNPAFCALIGYTEDELKGLKIAELIHPDELEHHLYEVGRIKSGEASFFETDSCYLHRNGHPVWVHKHVSLLPRELGQPDRVMALVSDITERRNREQMLIESEARYRNLFDAESDAIIIFDNETGRFVDVNDAAVKLYGYSHEEFLGLSYAEVTAEPEASDTAIHAMLEGRLTSVANRLHRKKDGSFMPVDISGCSFKWEGRTMVCGICRDVSERVDRDEEIQNYQEELRHLASELSLAEQRERQRVATELHDGVSQLLSSAYLRLDNLLQQEFSEAGKETLEKISDILNQALKETRSLTFELSCPMLHELGLAASLEELCNSMNSEHGIHFEFIGELRHFPLPLDYKIIIFRAVRELLMNVLKHSGAGHAQVTLVCRNGNVEVRVEDDGKGFDASTAGAGFSSSGGFGLFSTGEYIRHVGGTMKVDSAIGGGTKVLVSVPLEA